MHSRCSLIFGWLSRLLLVVLLCQAGFAAAEILPTGATPMLGTPPTRSASEAGASLLQRRTFTATAGASDLTVDLSQRESSRSFYQTVYQASENVPSGWTGDVGRGVAGTTSQAFKDSIALRVNYFRAMVGVFAGVTLSPDLSLKDQQAALMMSVNRQLSHAPTSAWSFYSTDGADAAGHSNISLGVNGPAAVTGYIQDPGDWNTAVGHRRWLFNPTTSMMASGDVDGSAASGYSPANALWVFGGGAAPASPAMRDGFVAWPPPGYVPYSLIFSRWSLSYPAADFSQATVTMTRNGQTIPTQISAVFNGYGDNTLVWIPNDQNTSGAEGTLPKPTQDTATMVTVGNVLVGGAARTFTYQVTAYDPAVTGKDVTPADLPTVILIANAPTVTAGSGGQGAFTLVMSASRTQDTVVNFTVKGSAANGVDYVTLKSSKKIKAGKSSQAIKVIPLGAGGGTGVRRTVILSLLPGDGYAVGSTDKVKVKIIGR